MKDVIKGIKFVFIVVIFFIFIGLLLPVLEESFFQAFRSDVSIISKIFSVDSVYSGPVYNICLVILALSFASYCIFSRIYHKQLRNEKYEFEDDDKGLLLFFERIVELFMSLKDEEDVYARNHLFELILFIVPIVLFNILKPKSISGSASFFYFVIAILPIFNTLVMNPFYKYYENKKTKIIYLCMYICFLLILFELLFVFGVYLVIGEYLFKAFIILLVIAFLFPAVQYVIVL